MQRFSELSSLNKVSCPWRDQQIAERLYQGFLLGLVQEILQTIFFEGGSWQKFIPCVQKDLWDPETLGSEKYVDPATRK